MISEKQVATYLNSRRKGTTQKEAAKKARISVKSGRNIEKGKRVLKKERAPSTREDPFAEVFPAEIVPLLLQGTRPGSFLLKHLQHLYPGKFSGNQLRTLQRRVSRWKLAQD